MQINSQKPFLRFNAVLLTMLCTGMITTIDQAAAAPPDNTFKYGGKLYMARNQGDTADTQLKEVRLTPDMGFIIDSSYHQSSEPRNTFAGGDQQKATSPLHPNDIPNGIYLEVGGGWYWSIQPPLKLYGNMDDLTPDGRVQSYTFTARLYCGPEPAPGPGCNAYVDVWFKQKAMLKASSMVRSKSK